MFDLRDGEQLVGMNCTMFIYITPWQVSSRDESFLDLSIDIEQNSSVTACLRQFSASEMLCQKNKFFCDSCCDLQEAEKRYVSFQGHRNLSADISITG